MRGRSAFALFVVLAGCSSDPAVLGGADGGVVSTDAVRGDAVLTPAPDAGALGDASPLDAGSADAVPAADAVFADLGATPADATVTADAGALADASQSDASQSDASQSDASQSDASRADASQTDASDTGACASCWRSSLYPETWSPGFSDPQGRSLPDFSYAGYHNGEAEPPRRSGPIFDVTTHGADPTGATDSTAAFQRTIDAASTAGGGVVLAPAGTYRIDDRILVETSSVVLRGAGPSRTRLVFTKDTGMTGLANLEVRGRSALGPHRMLAAEGQRGSFDVELADTTGLSPGDDVALGVVITPDFIAEHGMTGTWQAFNGTWQVFFRRTIVSIDAARSPPRVTLDVPLRYPLKLRDQASLRLDPGYLSEVGVEDLAVSNAIGTREAWSFDRAHVIELGRVKDGWVRNVESFDSPDASGTDHLQSGGVYVLESKRVTVMGSSMRNAQNRGSGGNGYLFEVSMSSEVLFKDSVAVNGRHNFIQNWGFGTTGCVFLRCTSTGSRILAGSWDPIGAPAYSEFHHSLATANLIDQTTLEDGWKAENRGTESTGAGHTATDCVFWNVLGTGNVYSRQFGMGYVIGPNRASIITTLTGGGGRGSAPEDFVEREPRAGLSLEPTSLYEDQLRRRLGGP